MSESDYSHFSITVLAAEIEEEVVRVKNLEAAIDDLPEARERLAVLRAEMLKRVAPEQPSHKHPEKGIFNLDDATAHIVEKDVERILAEDSAEATESDPITPMADLNPSQQDNYFDGLPNGQAQE